MHSGLRREEGSFDGGLTRRTRETTIGEVPTRTHGQHGESNIPESRISNECGKLRERLRSARRKRQGVKSERVTHLRLFKRSTRGQGKEGRHQVDRGLGVGRSKLAQRTRKRSEWDRIRCYIPFALSTQAFEIGVRTSQRCTPFRDDPDGPTSAFHGQSRCRLPPPYTSPTILLPLPPVLCRCRG